MVCCFSSIHTTEEMSVCHFPLRGTHIHTRMHAHIQMKLSHAGTSWKRFFLTKGCWKILFKKMFFFSPQLVNVLIDLWHVTISHRIRDLEFVTFHHGVASSSQCGRSKWYNHHYIHRSLTLLVPPSRRHSGRNRDLIRPLTLAPTSMQRKYISPRTEPSPHPSTLERLQKQAGTENDTI